MANRPVFVPKNVAPFYDTINVEFKYYSGFSMSQKRKSINSLHEAFHNLYPEKKTLEISSKSENKLGVKLSAFNLTFIDGVYRNTTVECAYQSGKIFEYGGPYLDLLSKTSKEAKKDPRLSQSGNVIGFRLNDKNYIQKNIEVFYSFLYISALKQNIKLAEDILNYDAFTDIIYNPKKSVSCQARSAAMFVGMSMAGITDVAENNQYWNQLISEEIRFLQEQNNDAAAAVLKKAAFDVENTYHDCWRWGTDCWTGALPVKEAIEDAELFLRDGRYDYAFDRIQTSFSDYIKQAGVDDRTRAILRSADAIIDTINELENTETKVNTDWPQIGKRKAQLAIGLADAIVEYIEDADRLL